MFPGKRVAFRGRVDLSQAEAPREEAKEAGFESSWIALGSVRTHPVC